MSSLLDQAILRSSGRQFCFWVEYGPDQILGQALLLAGIVGTLAGVLLVLSLVLLVVDCAGGRTEYFTGRVCGRHYEAPYTTPGYFSHSSNCSGSGRSRHCQQETTWHPPVYHPPRWVMHVRSREGESRFDVSERRYEQLQAGQPVALRCQVGRYTGWHYPASEE